jgi:CubicO group peptidase (beta-lactamase class C family)
MAWREDAARSLTETFDGAFDSPGVVVAAACVDEAGTGIGVSPGDTPADGRFEIGSVTKTMTAALLALLADDGALSLDDEEGLRQATAAPGGPWLYSNFGYHLLGLVLERASGQSYQALVTRRLLEPLAMTCSGVEDAGAGTRLPGHAGGGEVPHWDHPLGAGGVEATVADLGRYAQACLHPPGTPLGAAITAAMAPQIPLANGGRQALAWQVRPDGIRVHGGGTGGFSSAVLVDQGRGRAVAMLVSSGVGYSTALGRAGLLALAGDDPRPARPQPPGPEWEDRAREVVRLLLDGRTADVHAPGSATFQSHVPAERVERAWHTRTQDLGPAGQVTVRCQGPSGHVVADVTIAFARDAVAVRIGFEPSGQVGGLRVQPPGED